MPPYKTVFVTSYVWSEKAGPFPSEKCRGRDINLSGTRWDVMEN